MKRQLAPLVGLFLALTSPYILAGSTTIYPGVRYFKEKAVVPPNDIYVIQMDRKKSDLKVTTALGEQRIYGIMPLSAIVRAETKTRKFVPLAAINGDYFFLEPSNYQGGPQNLQVLDGELVTSPTQYPVFWIKELSELGFSVIQNNFKAIWPGNQFSLKLDINRQREDYAAVLYSPIMGISPSDTTVPLFSTRTIGGLEYVLEAVPGQPWLPLQAGKILQARVSQIGTYNTQIQKNQLILSIGPTLVPDVPALKVGDVLQLSMKSSPDLTGVKNASGTIETLVQNGQIVADTSTTLAPRTAIGWNETNFFFFAVDGRTAQSVGMTMQELAKLTIKYKCTNSLSLDGGGSTTMWVKGKIVNNPSDGEQRNIANALILYTEPFAGKK